MYAKAGTFYVVSKKKLQICNGTLNKDAVVSLRLFNKFCRINLKAKKGI